MKIGRTPNLIAALVLASGFGMLAHSLCAEPDPSQ